MFFIVTNIVPRKTLYKMYLITGEWKHSKLFGLVLCENPLQAQGSHRLEKYLNLEGFLEKSLKITSALKRTGKSLKSLEKSLNSTIFCRT